MPAGPVSRPWRRFQRFSVRGLIVFVIVIGGGLGWLVRSARIQREAVAAIERNGGWVRYNSGGESENRIPRGRPWAPRWLVSRIGVDFFFHVTAVRVSSESTATDAVIAHVGRLTQLESLDLDGTSVSDAGLARLEGLTDLVVLSLCGTHVTDSGLAHLKDLTNLASLHLDFSHVTERGAIKLEGALPGLTITR